MIEFQETILPQEVKGHVSLVDALYKLEAGKDIPSVTLTKINGNSLEYSDFIDCFKIHIHEDTHMKYDQDGEKGTKTLGVAWKRHNWIRFKGYQARKSN